MPFEWRPGWGGGCAIPAGRHTGAFNASLKAPNNSIIGLRVRGRFQRRETGGPTEQMDGKRKNSGRGNNRQDGELACGFSGDWILVQ